MNEFRADEEDMNEPQSAREPEPTERPLAAGQVLLASVAGLVRLIPHPWNFSPTYAVEVFAGARLRSWQAFALALSIRVVTDLAILLFPFSGQQQFAQFYLADMPWVYLSVLLNVLLGRLLQRSESPWRVGGVTLLASVQFFLVTNFGSWLGSPIYSQSAAGLVECYVAGIPFFRTTFLSYLIFTPVLFGAYAWLRRNSLRGERATA
jgi:hypothetical protein